MEEKDTESPYFIIIVVIIINNNIIIMQRDLSDFYLWIQFGSSETEPFFSVEGIKILPAPLISLTVFWSNIQEAIEKTLCHLHLQGKPRWN